jgi:HK97 family phage portal protein
MWPFDRRRKDKQRAAFMPGPPGGHGFGGDPFWSWGSLAGDGGVSPRACENLSAVCAAVAAISSTISSLPAYVVRSDDSRASVDDHPLQKLIDGGVNDEMNWSDYLEALLSSALLRGNALSEIETDDRGRLRALHFLPWDAITPLLTDQGTMAFDYLPTAGIAAGKRRRLGRDDCLFLKDRSDDQWVGVSRLSRAAGAMKLALDLQSYSSAFLQNSARPGGTLKTTTNIADEQRRKVKEEWDAAFRGREYGKVAILPPGMEYAALSQMSSDDQQIVAHRTLTVSEIARVFGVPVHVLADPQRSTYSSAKEASRQFAVQTLSPWVAKLQRCFAQSVLGTQYRLIIDLGDLLRADPEARWASWQRARAAGVLSPNDVRAEEGWPASNDPTANSIEPPVSGGQPASDGTGDTPSAPPPADSAPVDDASKIARLGDRRSRHGGD